MVKTSPDQHLPRLAAFLTVAAFANLSLLAAEPPAETSLRDQARDVVRSDKQFLDNIEVLEQSDAPPPPRAAPQNEPDRTPGARENLPSLSPEKLQRFVNRYLTAAQGPRPEGELGFFGPTVDYFDRGRVSWKVVEKDQRAYYRRWPSRSFTLLNEPRVERVSERAATVRFRMRYALRRGGESASGQTENILRIKRTAAGLKIVGIRERKIPN